MERLKDFINIDPEILGGTPVFRGTRVPVEILFEYLRESTVEEFLEGYPHVSRAQVQAVIRLAERRFLGKPLAEAA